MSKVTVIKKHPTCTLCSPKGTKALLHVRLGKTNTWCYLCMEHWLQDIKHGQEAPFLGTNIGQVLMTKEQVRFFPDHWISPKKLQRKYGNDARYAMLIRGNTVEYTQDRSYTALETYPPVLRCVFDIMTRLIPHESDLQDGGIKIWLKGKWA